MNTRSTWPTKTTLMIAAQTRWISAAARNPPMKATSVPAQV